MDNTLMVYLNKRLHLHDNQHQSVDSHSGPVICISREVGCGGVNIARLLAAEFNKQSASKKWKVVSKEIIEESAHELNMEPNKLQNIMKEGERGLFDDILTAFSEKRYKSDRKIRKTIIDLISSFANDGYCIIVGRAGHIIARDVEKSLLIKLTAPFEWRLNQIMQKNNLKTRDAMDFIEKTEKERHNLRKHIAGENGKEDEFDLTINLSRLNITEVISIIHSSAQIKGLFETNKSKMEVF